MNNQPRNKTLIIIIAILLLANVATLSYFLWKGDNRKNERPDRAAHIHKYLKEQVGFSEGQLTTFDSVFNKNRADVRATFDEMSTVRERVLTQLAARSFSDSAIDHAAGELSVQQRNVEIRMLHHMKELRDICTAAQLPAFDSGFYKMIGRKKESKLKKEKR